MLILNQIKNNFIKIIYFKFFLKKSYLTTGNFESAFSATVNLSLG